ncbi:MAG: glycoside hydrolase family 3 protein [Oscillospiraceae bacterium]
MNQKRPRRSPLTWAASILGILALLAVAVTVILALKVFPLGSVPESIPSGTPPVSFPPPSAAPSPTPIPAPTPAPTEEELRSARAEEILENMTLHEKVCQLFIVYPEAITGVPATITAGSTTEQALADWPVGGFLYDKKNMNDRQQVTDMLTTVQTMTKIPLILTCDEEGGRVNRLMSTVGTTWVGPMLDYKDDGPETAFENAETIAADLLSCGFNTDLAPVADVWSNPSNTVIGDRAYSDDFAQAAELVAAAVEGFHAGGVACTLKHFPGHGNTSADSHYGAVYVERTVDQLRDNELLPFQAGIDAGADAVMIGHLIVSDLDSEPAPFSYKIVTGLLREEMGFDGVVMTDGLQMKAMTDHYSSADIAVKAVQAGVDMLLCPLDLRSAVTALEEAVEAGTITQARLDESVLRILELKLRQGLLT